MADTTPTALGGSASICNQTAGSLGGTTPHPVACWCHGAASDLNCPTRWNGLVGATNCARRTPHRGHTWHGRHPWEWQTLCALRCRGVRWRTWLDRMVRMAGRG